MPPKPKRLKDQLAEKRYWFATHRVKYVGDNEFWEYVPVPGEGWEPCAYENVPDQLWSMRFKRDGWTFYTDRTRECTKSGFPIRKD